MAARVTRRTQQQGGEMLELDASGRGQKQQTKGKKLGPPEHEDQAVVAEDGDSTVSAAGNVSKSSMTTRSEGPEEQAEFAAVSTNSTESASTSKKRANGVGKPAAAVKQGRGASTSARGKSVASSSLPKKPKKPKAEGQPFQQTETRIYNPARRPSSPLSLPSDGEPDFRAHGPAGRTDYAVSFGKVPLFLADAPTPPGSLNEAAPDPLHPPPPAFSLPPAPVPSTASLRAPPAAAPPGSAPPAAISPSQSTVLPVPPDVTKPPALSPALSKPAPSKSNAPVPVVPSKPSPHRQPAPAQPELPLVQQRAISKPVAPSTHNSLRPESPIVVGRAHRRVRAGSAPPSTTMRSDADSDGARPALQLSQLTREEMLQQVALAVTEAEQDDDVEVDDDGAPIAEDDSAERAHAHGPMPEWQKKKIEDITSDYLKVMADVAREFNRSESAVLAEAKIALKLTRKPSLYNRFVQWWCATHENKDADGNNIPLRELRKLWLADYRTETTNATPEQKAALMKRLTDWEEAFVARNAEKIKQEGNLYKMMLRIRLDFESLAAYYYRLYDVVVVGFVVSSRPGDANAMEANSIFAPNKALLKVFKNSNLKASMGELGAVATTQRAADVGGNEWSKEREDFVCEQAGQPVVKKVVSDVLRNLQSAAWNVPGRTQTMWTKSLIWNVRKRVVFMGWVPNLPLPNPEKVMLGNSVLCKDLIRADFATRRGELEGLKRLGFRPMTPEECALKNSPKTRAEWLKVPIWIDSDGTVLRTVADAIAEFSEEVKVEEGVKGEENEDNDRVDTLNIEDEPPAKKSRSKRGATVAIDTGDDQPAGQSKAKRKRAGSGAGGDADEPAPKNPRVGRKRATTAPVDIEEDTSTKKGSRKRRAGAVADIEDEPPAKKTKPAAKRMRKPPLTEAEKRRQKLTTTRVPFQRDPNYVPRDRKFVNISDEDSAGGEEGGEGEALFTASEDEDEDGEPDPRKTAPSPVQAPEGAEQFGGGAVQAPVGAEQFGGGAGPSNLFHTDDLADDLRAITEPPRELPYETSLMSALASGTAVGLQGGPSGSRADVATQEAWDGTAPLTLEDVDGYPYTIDWTQMDAQGTVPYFSAAGSGRITLDEFFNVSLNNAVPPPGGLATNAVHGGQQVALYPGGAVADGALGGLATNAVHGGQQVALQPGAVADGALGGLATNAVHGGQQILGAQQVVLGRPVQPAALRPEDVEQVLRNLPADRLVGMIANLLANGLPSSALVPAHMPGPSSSAGPAAPVSSPFIPAPPPPAQPDAPTAPAPALPDAPAAPAPQS